MIRAHSNIDKSLWEIQKDEKSKIQYGINLVGIDFDFQILFYIQKERGIPK